MINFKQVDLVKYPKFKEATPVQVEISSGEILFIPEGWWHQVARIFW
jgi:hypothetical protein